MGPVASILCVLRAVRRQGKCYCMGMGRRCSFGFMKLLLCPLRKRISWEEGSFRETARSFQSSCTCSPFISNLLLLPFRLGRTNLEEPIQRRLLSRINHLLRRAVDLLPLLLILPDPDLTSLHQHPKLFRLDNAPRRFPMSASPILSDAGGPPWRELLAEGSERTEKGD